MFESFEELQVKKNLIEIKKELPKKYSIIRLYHNLFFPFLIEEFYEKKKKIFVCSKKSEKIFPEKIIEYFFNEFEIVIELDTEIEYLEETELSLIKNLMNDEDNFINVLNSRIRNDIKTIEDSSDIYKNLKLLIDNKKRFLILEFENELLYVFYHNDVIKYVTLYNYFAKKKLIENYLIEQNGNQKELTRNIKSKIIGNNNNIDEMLKLIEMRKFNFFKNNKYLLGSFMFLGDTGTGKTDLSIILSEEVFSREPLVIDCTTLTHAELITNTFYGSGRGFVDSDIGGIFNENNVKNRVVLFDEIEKAHPSIYTIIMNILDKGYSFDARTSEKILFIDSLVIITTNLIRENKDMKLLKKELLDNKIPKEVLGRIDKFYYFKKDFTKQELLDIGMKIFEEAIKEFPISINNKFFKYYLNKEKIKNMLNEIIPENLEFGIRELKGIVFKFLEEKYYPTILKEIENQHKKLSIITFD